MRTFFTELYQIFEVAFVRTMGGDVHALLLRQSKDQPLGRVATAKEMIG